MNKLFLSRSIVATTHLDLHNDQYTKDDLERAAQEINYSRSLMYWNHETTLLPIGLQLRGHVELRPDGEYQLVVEVYHFQEKDMVLLPQSDFSQVNINDENLLERLKRTPISSLGYLGISYDPQNFDQHELEPFIEDLNELLETHVRLYERKCDLPQTVIWFVVCYAAANIASGFLSRLGEVAADKFLQEWKSFNKRISQSITQMLKTAKQPGQGDIIFKIPIEGSITNVEGAVENAEFTCINDAVETLPILYAIATTLIESHRPNHFSHMKFLFNPVKKDWEINYLVTGKTNQIIKGPRYYDPDHPLRKRYHQAMKSVSQQDWKNLGMSVGGIRSINSKNPASD